MTGPRPAEPRWTEREERQLLEMSNAGKTAVEISRKLKRTPGAIYSRLQRLYRKQPPRSDSSA
jgi:DNA-binding CsgD family transcriptional regulator